MTPSRRRFLESSAALLALAGAAGLAATPAAAQGAYDLAEMMKPGPLPEITLGKDDAPVTVVEYASMTCSHCAHFHHEVFPYLKEKYIDTGKVKLVFREFPLDPLAAAVSMLSRCAPRDKYFDVMGLFFETQMTWARADNPVDALFNLSKQVGFTQDSFKTCLTDQKLLDGINAVKDRAADTFRVDGTPTFFVNGRPTKGIGSRDDLDKVLAPYVK